MGNLHLSVVGSEPVSEGRFGCDYAWNADYSAYRCLPHRWMPGSDSSYARYQAGPADRDDE